MENDIKILYEDNHLIIAVKPRNMPSQQDVSGDADMLSCLKGYIKEKYLKPGNVYLGLVHRLDRPTGGVMVFARTSKAASRLHAQIKSGKLDKKYMAVLEGTPEKSGRLVDYLKKDHATNTVTVADADDPDARTAVLDYRIIGEQKGFSLADITLGTGRSHQIRVQFAHLGTPVAGDRRYGSSERDFGLCLWAYRLSLDHPVTGERLTFTADPPDEVPWSYFR